MSSPRHRLLARLCHTYPFVTGCGMLANSRPFRLLAGSERGLAWAELRCGLRLRVPLEDYVGRTVYFFGDLDPKISWIARRLLRPGDQVLDVGANLGLVTLLCASLVGPSGAVHAFEPNPGLCALLEQSLRENGLAQAHLHRVALGTRDDTLELAVPADNAGAASLVRRASGQAERLRVPVRNTTDYFEKSGIAAARLLKLDVEGFESEVLEGARGYLEVTPPDAVLFETNDPGRRSDSHASAELLREYDYTIFAVTRGLLRPGFVPFDAAVAGLRVNDCLAVHRARVREVMARLA